MNRRATALTVAGLAIAAASVAIAGAGPAGAADGARVPTLEFVGQDVIPTGTTFAGTRVGGLSGVAYDASRDVFYSLSDDPSQFAPARFYTLRIDASDGRLDPGDTDVVDVTTLTQPDGTPFAPFGLDPEGIALTKDRELVITSEGFANAGVAPWIRTFDLAGRQTGELAVPDAFEPSPGTRGVRHNLAFESAATAPNGRFLFTGTEGALVQDGPPATVTERSPARLLRYNLKTGKLDRQYVYWTDAIARPPVPETAFAVSGLVDLLPLNNEFLLAMERSFSLGVPGTGNTIRLYLVKVAGADDVNGVDSLAGSLDDVRAVEKTLLLDLDELGIPLDNVEGMTFGPDLPDGRRSLVLVSDDNFLPFQFTQLLLFAYSES